jgi:hypothetical protein
MAPSEKADGRVSVAGVRYEELLCGNKYGIMNCWIVPQAELQHALTNIFQNGNTFHFLCIAILS